MRPYYRPVVTLSYAADYAAWGLAPAGFHATNVAFHLLNVALLFAVARRAGASPLAASLAAALWGLAPRLTESVTWISGRTDVLSATPVLLALLVWDGESRARRLAVAALFAVGLGCKEVAAALLPALFLLEWKRALPARDAMRRAARRVLPLAVVLVLFLVARHFALPYATAPDLIGRKRPLVVLEAVARFAGMILDPLHPKTQIGRVMVPEPRIAAAGLGVLAVVVLACLLGFRRLAPRVVAALAVALASLLSVIHIVPIANNVVAADRFLYLPLAGLAIALAAAESALPRLARGLLLVAAVVGLSTFPFATYRQNAVWSNETHFWAVTIRETRRDNTYPLVEFGRVLFRTGRFQALIRTMEAIPFGGSDEHGTGAGLYDLGPLRGDRALALDAMSRFESAAQAIDEWAHGVPAAPAVLEGAYRLQHGDFEGARAVVEKITPGPPSGSLEIYRRLLRLVDANRLERVWRDTADPARLAPRARLLRPVGGWMAESAWSDVVREPRAPLSDRLEGLDYLYERGERADLLRAIAAIRPALRDAGDRQELIERLAARDRDDVEVRDVVALITARSR